MEDVQGKSLEELVRVRTDLQCRVPPFWVARLCASLSQSTWVLLSWSGDQWMAGVLLLAHAEPCKTS